ncbi:hypothetical protein HYT26_02310 [Candidatus Pacearchaeota archaeon]|nr:hypothetical protein [Candidatus Pacearchaeota archaeon]
MERCIRNIEQIHDIIAVETNVTGAKNRLNKKAVKEKLAEIELHTKKCKHCSNVLNDFLRDVSKITNG